jgi:hypothetical protein
MSRPSSGRDANRDCDFSVAIFQILPATSILANLHSKLLGYSPSPDFSRHLVECWGKLSLARPQSAPVIWA